MRRSRYREEQILAILKEADAGPVMEVLRHKYAEGYRVEEEGGMALVRR